MQDIWLSERAWTPLLDSDYSIFCNHNCSENRHYLDVVKGSFGGDKELHFINNDEINYYYAN